MSGEIFSRVVDTRELHEAFEAKVAFIARDSSWLDREEAALRSLRITHELFSEEVANAVLDPVRSGRRRDRPSGGVRDTDGRPVQLANVYHREEVVFGEESHDVDTGCTIEIAEGIWAGVLTKHFGHFITEGIARLHAAWDNDLPILYLGKFSEHPRAHLQPWMIQVLSAIGINPDRIVLIEQPTRVGRLIVPKPGIELGRAISPEFINKIKQRSAISAAGSALRDFTSEKKRVLSRTEYSDGRRAIGELAMQSQLISAGWEAVHPERISFSEQLRLINASRAIAGVYGSQLHTLLFRSKSSPLNTVFLVTSYFNQTYIHTELITPGLKVVGKCDLYDRLPTFGNRTPYMIDNLVARRSFEMIDAPIEFEPPDLQAYTDCWQRALIQARDDKRISAARSEDLLRLM